MKPFDEISVRIIIGIVGPECYIDAPLDITMGDIIAELVNAKIMYSDTDITKTVFYKRNTNNVISFDIKYDDLSKTIKEYGWNNGDVFVAICEVLYY